MAHLYKHSDTLARVVLDDFVEQTFLYRGSQPVPGHRQPWVGIFHHPPNAPDWFWNEQKLQYLFCRPSFVDSVPYLKGIIVLSNYLGEYMPKLLRGIPVKVLKHPIERGPVQYGTVGTPARTRLLNFGWYLRDTQILTRIPDNDYDKLRLWPGAKNQRTYDELVKTHSSPGIHSIGSQMDYVPNDVFDHLLATSVAVAGFFDCSAANGVLDCVARCTPLIVNRHPAIVEYLGADYPLFYDEHKEIPDLILKADDGNGYLREMDTTWMDGDIFAEQVAQAVKEFAD